MAKNLLKRLIPLIAGVGIVAAGASNVVSCVAPQYAAGIDGQRVVVSTDGGHINDNSFNEDAYIGVKKFVKDTYNLDGKNNFVEAGGTDQTSIISGYRMAVLKRANAVVLPGFSHVNTLPSILPTFHKHNINTVLVDGIVKDPRVISLRFNSQISGFMAGFDTSYLFGTTRNEDGSLKYDVNGDKVIRIGTFAGSSNKYGVDNYMWGLLLGMQVYDDVIAKNPQLNAAQVYSANIAGGNVKDISVSQKSDPDFWTNSFALGAATQMGMPAKLIDNNGLNKIGGADVVFPVAGPQIQDVLTYKPNTGKLPYLIGVDVDQEAAYSDYKGRFVTSAIKNIDTAVPEALYRATSPDNKVANTLKPISSPKDINNPNSTVGQLTKQGKADFENGNKFGWLGTTPTPFVNWSIDYTDDTTPTDQGQGRYLLKQHYIKLYDESQTETIAQYAMAEINEHFASLGPNAPDYMQGSDIYTFADTLVKEYGATMKNNLLDWYKAPADITTK